LKRQLAYLLGEASFLLPIKAQGLQKKSSSSSSFTELQGLNYNSLRFEIFDERFTFSNGTKATSKKRGQYLRSGVAATSVRRTPDHRYGFALFRDFSSPFPALFGLIREGSFLRFHHTLMISGS